MKFLALVCSVQDGEGFEPICVSPTDDVWFVKPENFSADLLKLQVDTEKKGNVEVLGAIFVPGDE